MIEPASLIGFALAMGATAWTASVACGVLLLSCRARLRSRPNLEREAASAALLLPAVAGLAIGVALLGKSIAVPLLGLEDHCPAHVHHLHLCLFHGAAWLSRPVAVAVVAGGGALMAVGLVRLVGAQIHATFALRRLAVVSRAVHVNGAEVLVVPSSRVFLFVGGLIRPRIFASSAAWDALDDEERRAAVAHEHAHVGRGDVLRRIGLRACALLGAPGIAGRALAFWTSATERICDRDAAASSGDPSIVAQALVTLARLGTGPAPAHAISFAPSPDELTLRIEALLAAEPSPDDRGLPRALAWLPAGLVAGALLFADGLHHGLETILEIF